MTRAVGIDYGSVRIGIALSDPLRRIATGRIVVKQSAGAIGEIARFIRDNDAGTVVIGMPLNLKGEEGSKAGEVRRFAEALAKEVSVEIVFWDERFTSRTAHETLREMGVRKMGRRDKSRIDIMSAALILQGYLDSAGRQA